MELAIAGSQHDAPAAPVVIEVPTPPVAPAPSPPPPPPPPSAPAVDPRLSDFVMHEADELKRFVRGFLGGCLGLNARPWRGGGLFCELLSGSLELFFFFFCLYVFGVVGAAATVIDTTETAARGATIAGNSRLRKRRDGRQKPRWLTLVWYVLGGNK